MSMSTRVHGLARMAVPALFVSLAVLCIVPVAFATAYTNDPNLTDFTNKVSNYATFSDFSGFDGNATTPTFTPTAVELCSCTTPPNSNNVGARLFRNV